MHLSYLFAAYTLVWLGIFVYIVGLDRRSRALQREVQELKQLLTQPRP